MATPLSNQHRSDSSNDLVVPFAGSKEQSQFLRLLLA